MKESKIKCKTISTFTSCEGRECEIDGKCDGQCSGDGEEPNCARIRFEADVIIKKMNEMHTGIVKIRDERIKELEEFQEYALKRKKEYLKTIDDQKKEIAQKEKDAKAFYQQVAEREATIKEIEGYNSKLKIEIMKRDRANKALEEKMKELEEDEDESLARCRLKCADHAYFGAGMTIEEFIVNNDLNHDKYLKLAKKEKLPAVVIDAIKKTIAKSPKPKEDSKDK